MRSRERGFTVIEMMLACVLLGSLLAAVGATLHQAKKASDVAESAAADVLALQRALAAVERDLRCATDFERFPGGTRVFTPAGPVAYSVRGGDTLLRTAGGRTDVVARGIARVRIDREGENLLRATVEVLKRNDGGRARVGATTVVALRATGGPR
jgi:prepilin-type N-terminal cleavage/methylation domain-containing protein